MNDEATSFRRNLIMVFLDAAVLRDWEAEGFVAVFHSAIRNGWIAVSMVSSPAIGSCLRTDAPLEERNPRLEHYAVLTLTFR